jgi:hypothetical protein
MFCYERHSEFGCSGLSGAPVGMAIGEPFITQSFCERPRVL